MSDGQGRRISLTVPPREARTLEEYMDEHGGTLTDALARHVRAGRLVLKAPSENKDVLLRDRENGQVDRIVVV